MARKDDYHDNVREALEKAGWNITHDPYNLRFLNKKGKKKNYPIDLGAERIIAAEKDLEKIAVEVKTFGGSSVMNDFNRALGQYMSYWAGLEEQEPNRKLFVAISEEIYYEIIDNPLANLSLNRYKLSLLIFDLDTNTIIKWIK